MDPVGRIPEPAPTDLHQSTSPPSSSSSDSGIGLDSGFCSAASRKSEPNTSTTEELLCHGNLSDHELTFIHGISVADYFRVKYRVVTAWIEAPLLAHDLKGAPCEILSHILLVLAFRHLQPSENENIRLIRSLSSKGIVRRLQDRIKRLPRLAKPKETLHWISLIRRIISAAGARRDDVQLSWIDVKSTPNENLATMANLLEPDGQIGVCRRDNGSLIEDLSQCKAFFGYDVAARLEELNLILNAITSPIYNVEIPDALANNLSLDRLGSFAGYLCDLRSQIPTLAHEEDTLVFLTWAAQDPCLVIWEWAAAHSDELNQKLRYSLQQEASREKLVLLLLAVYSLSILQPFREEVQAPCRGGPLGQYDSFLVNDEHKHSTLPKMLQSVHRVLLNTHDKGAVGLSSLIQFNFDHVTQPTWLGPDAEAADRYWRSRFDKQLTHDSAFYLLLGLTV